MPSPDFAGAVIVNAIGGLACGEAAIIIWDSNPADNMDAACGKLASGLAIKVGHNFLLCCDRLFIVRDIIALTSMGVNSYSYDSINKGEANMLDARVEAAERGDYIYQGKPCRTCGSEARYVSSNVCVHCQKAHTKKYRDKARDAIKEARGE